MKLIADYYKPDLVLMPIGGHFVMDPQDAAYATQEWLKPKFVIPIHYGTFPVLKGTPQEYMAALGQTTTKVFAINPGIGWSSKGAVQSVRLFSRIALHELRIVALVNEELTHEAPRIFLRPTRARYR